MRRMGSLLALLLLLSGLMLVSPAAALHGGDTDGVRNVGFDAATADRITTCTTCTLTTVVTNGDTFMVASAAFPSSVTLNSVTLVATQTGIPDVSATFLRGQTFGSRRLEVWTTANAQSSNGGVAELRFGFSASTTTDVSVAFFTEATTVQSSLGASGTNENPTVTVTDVVADSIVYGVFALAGDCACTITSGSGQTRRWTIDGAAGATDNAGDTEPDNGLTSVTSSFVILGNTLDWGIIALDIPTRSRGTLATVVWAEDTTNGGISTTWTHDANTGDRRLAVVAIMHDTGTCPGKSTSTVTFGGVGMGLLTSSTSGATTVEIWYLREPATAGANTIVATYSSSSCSQAVASFTFNEILQDVAVTVLSRLGGTGTISTQVSHPMQDRFLVLSVLGLNAGGGADSIDPIDRAHQETVEVCTGCNGPRLLRTSIEFGSNTASTQWAWNGFSLTWNQVVIQVSGVPVPPPDPGPQPPGGGGFPSDTKPICPDVGPVDWLSASTVPGNRNVTIDDKRRVSVLQYLVSWGDGSAVIVPTTPVSHTYAKDDIYKITMRVQYRDGSIEIFVGYVDLRGNNCSLAKFATEFFPVLALLGGLSFIAALILLLTKHATRLIKFKKELRALLEKYLLLITAISIGIIIAVALYAAANGILI